jgi:hypothetical protein
MKKEEGRRKKEEGRGKKGRGKKEEGREHPDFVWAKHDRR